MMPAVMTGSLVVRVDFRNLTSLLAALAFVILLALVSGRLVGIKLGRWRSIVTALVGTVVGLAGAEAVVHGRSSDLDVAYALTAVFGVLATMLLLIVTEALLRTQAESRGRRTRRMWFSASLAPPHVRSGIPFGGSASRRSPPRPGPSAVPVLCRGDHPEFGLRLRLTLEDVGGMFVKFGQIASTRSDLLAAPVIEELSHLRADVRPIPEGQVRPLIEDELGRPVEEVFTSFDFAPLASASIGQAHRAVLKTGESVVVKIQRPGLDDLVRRDATVMRLVAGMAERRVPGARQFGIQQLADELINVMEHELDYLREAVMCDRLRVAIQHDDPADDVIRVPIVYHELCTDRFLVMEQAEGVTVDSPGAVQASGAPPRYLAAASSAPSSNRFSAAGCSMRIPIPATSWSTGGGDCGCSTSEPSVSSTRQPDAPSRTWRSAWARASR